MLLNPKTPTELPPADEALQGPLTFELAEVQPVAPGARSHGSESLILRATIRNDTDQPQPFVFGRGGYRGLLLYVVSLNGGLVRPTSSAAREHWTDKAGRLDVTYSTLAPKGSHVVDIDLLQLYELSRGKRYAIVAEWVPAESRSMAAHSRRTLLSNRLEITVP